MAMAVVAEAFPAQGDLLSQVEIENTREGGIIDAYVPIDLILRTDVPVDEEHVQELALSMREEAKRGHKGQLSPVLLAHIPELDQFVIIDGFHRVASIEPAGLENVYATIRPNSTWEEVIDLRILTANTHHSVRFARVIEWVEEAWRLSPWQDRLTPLQAFSLTNQKAQTGKNLGLSTDEAEQVKDWVRNKCRQWKLSPAAVYQNLNTARVADPELVREARERSGGRELKHITPQHLKVIASGLPHQFDVQRTAAEVAKDKNLTVRETEGVVMVLATSESVESAMQTIKSGQWTTFIPDKKKPPARAVAETSSDESPLSDDEMDEVEVRNVADKRTRALTASLKKFAALKKSNERLTRSLLVGDIDFVRLALENVVLRGKYVAPPLGPEQIPPIVRATQSYRPEPFAWTQERINQLLDRANQTKPAIAGRLQKEGRQAEEVDKILDTAIQRIIDDIFGGGLSYAEIADQHNFDKIFIACAASELALRSPAPELDDAVQLVEHQRPARPVELTSERLDLVVRTFEPQDRRAVVMSGVYGLPAFVIAQLMQKNPAVVEKGLGQLARQIESFR